MLPLIPSLILAFISFFASVFVILRIIIPILPPHPLSKRVSPAEFGLPTFKSLSPADKSHVWLAGLDLVALAMFIWQAISESTGGPSGFETANDPGSSVRLWLLMTIRQSCLLVVAAITLLHVRLGRSISFGPRHWMLWAPTLVLVITSTGLAAILSGTGVETLFAGLIAYTTSVAVLTSVALACLIGTLFAIKRNLNSLNEEADPWPPVREVEEKPRPSFATEDIDAIRDGASWITSTAGSRRGSISTWSFSTHHTVTASSAHGHGRPQGASHPSVPAKSSFWFGSNTQDPSIPPVPPLPSPYGPLSPTAEDLSDPDPFRRDVPSPLPNHPRIRLGSQTSWLTSSNGSHTTMTAWSYPTTYREGTIHNASTVDLHAPLTSISRPNTPNLASAQVLGGYGFAPGNQEAEKGLVALATTAETNVEVSVYSTIGWFFMIWSPIAFSLPYVIVTSQNTIASTAMQILFVLSITLSSPLLALSILCNSPFPIPTGLFDACGSLPKDLRSSSPTDNLPPYKWSHEYKRSMSASVTVVEGRRSGDVWLSKGDAVDGQSKLGRAVGMLNPMPKLSVLPTEEKDGVNNGLLSPPLPFQTDDSSLPVTIHNGTPHSETSAQFGRIRKDSKASSHLSNVDESLAVAGRIMVAQRHYSALAQTVVIPGTSPEKQEPTGDHLAVSSATGAYVAKRISINSHLRSRSVSSVSGPQTPTGGDSFNISPPPSFPLPPTPPNVRAARLAKLAHKKSFSSGFSFGPVDDMNEIDALTAGVLPLLVPGLKVGQGIRVVEGNWTPPDSFGKTKGKKAAKKLSEFGADFSSPEIHSTPARKRQPRARKESAHKRNHFSLPSLGLGKDGVHSLAAEIEGALRNRTNQYTPIPSNVEVGWRNTVFGAESIPNNYPHIVSVKEEGQVVSKSNLTRTMSTRSLGLHADVPHSVGTARSSVYSVASMTQPISAASTVTLFEELEASLQSGPQAESTPHNTVSSRPTRQNNPSKSAKNTQNRRSSIVYIKSDAPVTNTDSTPPETTPSAMSTFAQWSSKAVRPLIPKATKLQRINSKVDSSAAGKSSDSPREGLRPLALLQERSINIDTNRNSGSAVLEGPRPLALGKKQKSKMTSQVQDENADPNSTSAGNKNLKTLKLARSETSKMRGHLRKNEVLPNVVVRPPSIAEHTEFAHGFHGY